MIRAWSNPDSTPWGADVYRKPIVEWKPAIGPRFVVISDPKVFSVLLNKHAHDTDKHDTFRRMAEMTLKNGIVLSSGVQWRDLRSIVGKHVSPRVIAQTSDRTEAIGQGFAERLTAQGFENVDLLKEASRFTSAVVDDLLFRTGSDEDFDQTYEIFRYLDHGGYDMPIGKFLLGVLFPSLANQQETDPLGKTGTLRRIYARQLAEYRPRPSKEDDRRTLMDDLIALCADPDHSMTEEQIVSLVLELQYAGSHAAGAALGFLWYVLLTRPDLVERLQEEERSDVPDRPFAEAVINETLRFYPRAPIINRTPNYPIDLGATQVNPGDFIIVAPWIVHHHESLWDNPSVFDPTRFLSDAPRAIERNQFIPFGVGARGCLSEALSRSMMRSGLKLFLKFGPLRLRNAENLRMLLTGGTLSLTPALLAERVEGQ
jgi:cytochrome P450